MPSIYVDEMLETPTEGGNPERDSYRLRLEACEAGGRATTRLTTEEVDKLGTKRLERWWSPDRAAVRMEEWVLGSGSLEAGEFCKFYLASRGRHSYFDLAGSTTLRLHDGSEEVSATETHWQRKQKAAPEEMAQRRQREQQLGAPSNRTVAGQPCEQWELEHASVCTWTGGAQWGFSYSPPALANTTHQSHLMNRVILSQEPVSPGAERVETRNFVVGGEVDEAAMRPRPATAWPAGKPRER